MASWPVAAASAWAAATAVSLLAGGFSATAANAATGTPQFYLLDGGDGHLLPDDTVLHWDSQILATPGRPPARGEDHASRDCEHLFAHGGIGTCRAHLQSPSISISPIPTMPPRPSVSD